MADSITDETLGALAWDSQFEWWEGKIKLASDTPFILYLFARGDFTPDRRITDECRATVTRIVGSESEYRQYAAGQLCEIHNSEWNDGPPTSEEEFARRLVPDTVEVQTNA